MHLQETTEPVVAQSLSNHESAHRRARAGVILAGVAMLALGAGERGTAAAMDNTSMFHAESANELVVAAPHSAIDLESGVMKLQITPARSADAAPSKRETEQRDSSELHTVEDMHEGPNENDDKRRDYSTQPPQKLETPPQPLGNELAAAPIGVGE